MSNKPMLYKPVGSEKNHITDESILHVIRDQQDCLECISDYGYDDLIPLTVAEWWEFAPWESMDSAPTDGSHVLLCNEYGINKGYFYNQYWHSIDNSIFHNPTKWLPAPG